MGKSLPEHLRIGQLGEDIAGKWLIDKGFTVLERNYAKKWGEIDIIAERDKMVYFVEVKTVSWETTEALHKELSVFQDGNGEDTRGRYRPEEKVDSRKQQRLGRAIQTWIAANRFTGPFQIDVMTVRLVPREKYAVIEVIENVILE